MFSRRDLLLSLFVQRYDETTPYEHTVLGKFQEECYAGRASKRQTEWFYGRLQRALQFAAERHGKPCK